MLSGFVLENSEPVIRARGRIERDAAAQQLDRFFRLRFSDHVTEPCHGPGICRPKFNCLLVIELALVFGGDSTEIRTEKAPPKVNHRLVLRALLSQLK